MSYKKGTLMVLLFWLIITMTKYPFSMVFWLLVNQTLANQINMNLMILSILITSLYNTFLKVGTFGIQLRNGSRSPHSQLCNVCSWWWHWAWVSPCFNFQLMASNSTICTVTLFGYGRWLYYLEGFIMTSDWFCGANWQTSWVEISYPWQEIVGYCDVCFC